MVLSEAEAEARLGTLRREREALDRAITDLMLYLELGRRLRSPAQAADSAGPDMRQPDPPALSAGSPSGDVGEPAAMHEARQRPAARRDGAGASSPGERVGTAAPIATGGGGADEPELPQAAGETKSAPEDISEGALARRYGRALIREAVAVLERAGRPLHASEILSALAARGFSVPGRQDPVAALNTRLWKRAAPGGPLRRLGDAIYAPAEKGLGADRDQP